MALAVIRTPTGSGSDGKRQGDTRMKQDEDEQRTEPSSEDSRRRIVQDVAPSHGDRQRATDGASDGEFLQLFE